MKKVKNILFGSIIIAAVTAAQLCYGEDVGVIEQSKKDTAESVQKLTEIKVIEQKTEEKKQDIKEQTKTAEEVKKEAEKILEEKKIIEKEVEIKEKESAIIKQELEVAKEEARLTGDKQAQEKIKELAKAAEVIDGEAAIYQKKLSLTEEKARLAKEQIAKSDLVIKALNQELTNLKKEKASTEGWLPRAVKSAVVIVISIFLIIFITLFENKFSLIITDKNAIRERESILRLKTFISLFKWVSSIVVMLIASYILLGIFGINMAPFLAGAGILGVAFGFGGQYLIRDIINGFFILFEGQYRINDVIRVGDLGGLVEQINLRYTRLRDLEGRVIYIPNGEIKTVINFSQEFAQALLDIGVAYKESVDQVMEVLAEIGAEMRKDKYYGRLILDNLEMLGVDKFADSQVTIRCRMKTLPIKQWEVAREFRRRVKNRFDELDIEIPFPHKTVYEGKPKDPASIAKWEEMKKKHPQAKMKRGHSGSTE